MHILYIHTHDTGKFTSVYGKNVPTPHLKAFAEDALVFEQAFCVNPTCSPSRAALLTGTYPQQNGMLGLAHRGFELVDREQHLGYFLGHHGYHTALCGIQHEHERWLFGKGLETVQEGLGYQSLLTTKYPIHSDQDYVEWDRLNTENAVEFIDKYDDNRPIFLSMGFFSTHREYPELSSHEKKIYDERYIETPEAVFNNQANREDTAKLHKSLHLFDDHFNQVINALKKKGIYDETIIISTTDHGLANPFSKANLNDNGTNVSLIMRIPEYEQTFGCVTESLVSQLDIYPTLCDLLHIEKPEYLQGKSMIPLLNDSEEEINEYVFSQLNFHTSYEPARAIRNKRYKLIQYYDRDWQKYNLSNIDDSNIKTELIKNGLQTRRKPMLQLYDLLFDPEEKNNLADDSEYATIKEKMLQALEAWRISVDDSILEPKEYQGKYKVNKRECISPSQGSAEFLISAKK